jgi:hypothetical protein
MVRLTNCSILGCTVEAETEIELSDQADESAEKAALCADHHAELRTGTYKMQLLPDGSYRMLPNA